MNDFMTFIPLPTFTTFSKEQQKVRKRLPCGIIITKQILCENRSNFSQLKT